MEEAQGSDRFDVAVTILIALVTVFGAVIAWRASLSSSAAGNAEQQGLLDTLALEEGLASHQTRLYTDLQYFVRYAEYSAVASRLRSDEEAARSRGEIGLADDLAQEAELYEDLARNQEDFFDPAYVRSDGTFDQPAYLANLRLRDERVNRLDPDAVFAAANAYQEQAKRLIALISALTVALFFYTLSQITEHRAKYALAVAGTVTFLATAVGFAVIESMVR
jgi:hypothetical protein